MCFSVLKATLEFQMSISLSVCHQNLSASQNCTSYHQPSCSHTHYKELGSINGKSTIFFKLYYLSVESINHGKSKTNITQSQQGFIPDHLRPKLRREFSKSIKIEKFMYNALHSLDRLFDAFNDEES